MKFIDVNKAKGLNFKDPVYTLDSHGNYGYGVLVSENKTSDGTVRKFNLFVFGGGPVSCEIIVAVCIIKKAERQTAVAEQKETKEELLPFEL